MRLREWFRPPRHALLIFLGVSAVSGVALGWLGWLLLAQDKAVETQRRQEKLNDAADRAVSVMQRSIADLEDRLKQPSISGPPPAGVTVVTAGEDGIAANPGLPYYPEAERLPEGPAGTFTDAEQLEFAAANTADDAAHNLKGAARIYERLAGGVNAATQAGALTRLARVERRLRHAAEADRAYDRLAQLARTGVEGLPAGLIAREGRASLYQETHRTGDLAREAEALQNDLRAGRWQLDKEQYESYSADAAAWLGQAPPPDAAPPDAALLDGDGRARAEAFDWVWRNRGDGEISTPNARRLISVNGSPALAIWRQSDGRLYAAIAGPRYLSALGGEAVPAGGLHWAMADPEGRTVLGEAAPARQTAIRAAAVTRLPWTLYIFVADGVPAGTSPRQRLLLWVFAVLAVVLSAGAYFILRAISREMRVTRLQSDFVAAVSHEFRSPLSSLTQISEMLAHDRFPSASPSEDLRRSSYGVLVRETERLRRLVEGLLDFGRFEAGAAAYRFEELEACAFVRSVVSEFQERVAGQGHAIELSAPEGELPVRADREALGRAIWNLLDNAVKYSPECRTVWVEVGRDAERDANRISIVVRDRGLGIPAREQREIFDRFVRGADSKALRIRGTGIGLAMVRHIVQAHGGEIRLASEPGQGSRFTVVLKMAILRPAGGAS